MDRIAVAAPSLPPKTKVRPRSPPLDSQTVPVKTVTPSVSRIDVFHKSNSFSEQSRNTTHVVKILICPQNGNDENKTNVNLCQDLCIKNHQTDSDICDVEPFIRISVNSEMIQNNIMADTSHEAPNSYFDYGPYNCGTVSSGQISPSNTLDSGTCSDLDCTPPPLPTRNHGGISVTLIGSHTRPPSCSSSADIDSDGNDSSISCDSLNNDKISQIDYVASTTKSPFLPQMLLQDIRQRNMKLTSKERSSIIDEKSYEERKIEETQEKNEIEYNTDMFYKFHINEHLNTGSLKLKPVAVEDESFAGYKDLLGDGAATIRSAKGTVRGVKNRVRAGIATFLQINTTEKNYKEKEAGKVVVYTTTMGVLRETYQACMKVKQILRTLLVKFEERDVFMSSEYQEEIQERMHCNQILVPQVFVDGQHIGDAETVEILNETGELRRILKPFKSMDVCTTCKVCGGYRLLPCQICKGSKKSVHRNHFTTEFVALKCMNCDEVGLVRCSSCS